MGNSASTHRDRLDNTVDFGSLRPFGTYTGAQDWNQEIVAQLIKDRKLAPFYWPLEDYEDDWTDEQIMAARKVLPSETTSPGSDGTDTPPHTPSRTMSKQSDRSSVRSAMRIPEAQLYRGAVECPICFLYYPPNMNRSRCCDHYICTECFVQIKRADPTPQHLVSEPAACPYCVQENFGIIYTPPPWRAGIGSEGHPSPELYKVTSGSSLNPPPPPLAKQRRKSISHTSAEVVTIDQIRPDWEQKLAAVRAAVARRANRRIIMRQVGDRLIPVGISSGRGLPVQLDNTEGAQGGEGDDASRGSRRRRAHDLSQLLGSMGMAGQDLEELMVMEAMRLSLLEHEQAQRRQQEQEGRERTGESTGSNAGPSTGTATPLSASAPSGSRTPAIPIASRTPGSGSRTPTSSSVPSPLVLGSNPSGLPSLIGRTGSPRRNGMASGAGPSSSSPARVSFTDERRTPPPARPSSEVIDHSHPSSLHRAAVTAANEYLSSSAAEPTFLSTSTTPGGHAEAVMTASPTALSDAMSSSMMDASLPAPVPARTPPLRATTADSVRTDVSEDGGGSYEPLASPDTEESVQLLDRSLSVASEQHEPGGAGAEVETAL